MCSIALGGEVQHSPGPRILEDAVPEQGVKEGALLAPHTRTAELARQELCSTGGPSEVVGTRLCPPVWFSSTPCPPRTSTQSNPAETVLTARS